MKSINLSYKIYIFKANSKFKSTDRSTSIISKINWELLPVPKRPKLNRKPLFLKLSLTFFKKENSELIRPKLKRVHQIGHKSYYFKRVKELKKQEFSQLRQEILK